jgi:hypothetical protein
MTGSVYFGLELRFQKEMLCQLTDCMVDSVMIATNLANVLVFVVSCSNLFTC